MDQIANGMADGEKTYSLKVQSKYSGSDSEWWQREKAYVLNGRASTKGLSRMAWQKEKDVLAEDADQVR